MELKIKKDILTEGIQLVQNAVSVKGSLPILSNVLFEVSKDKLKLTATDLDIGICATMTASVKQDGAITIPARKFFDIVKSLPEESEIAISAKKNNFVTIQSGKAHFKIIGLPKEEFPLLPSFKDNSTIVIEQKVLKDMLNLTDFAVSKDDTRYVLNGTLCAVKGTQISMVATDGRRLAAIEKKLAQKTPVNREVIIPIKAIQEVKRMLGDEGEVALKFSENQVLFSFPDCFVVTRLIEGEYPNYKNVIPAKNPGEVKVSREEFLSAARRASIFTEQDSMAIKLSIKRKKMLISKNTPYLGEAKEEIEVDYVGGNEMEIGFNPRYLIDVLKNLTEEDVVLEVNDSKKPGVVRRGEEYTYVVLPMQLTA